MNKIMSVLKGEPAEAALLKPAIPVVNIMNFLEWYKAKGGSLEELDLPFSPEEIEFTKSSRWLNYLEHIKLQKSIIDRIEGFTVSDYFDMGYSGLKNKLILPYKVILALIPRRKFAVVLTRFAETLLNYVRITVLAYSEQYLRLRYDVDPLINEYSLGGLVQNVTGLICAAVEFKFGSAAGHRILRSQNKLANLILAAYERYDLSYSETGDYVFVDGEVVGRRILHDGAGSEKVTEITADLHRNGVKLLEKGWIYDAPYCEAEIFWEGTTPWLRRLRHACGVFFLRSKYWEQLGTQLEESQRNYFEACKAREEAERLSRELDVKNNSLLDLVTTLERKVADRTAHLDNALEQLKQTNILKSNLLGTVSHELRTPLTLLKIPLERILRGERGFTIAADDESLIGMSRQVERISNLLDDIIEFTALEMAEGTVQLHPCAIGPILSDVVADFLLGASISGLLLILEPLPETAVVVEGEPRLIKTAVSNLLSNAIKFTSTGGTVRVSLSVDSVKATISVRDNGIGIPSLEVDRIFERFFRSSNVKESTMGRGLGLVLVKEIAELHKGGVFCESVQGWGSKFSITIPLSSRPIEAAPDPAHDPGQRFLKTRRTFPAGKNPPETVRAVRAIKGRILYVEDNADLAELLRQGLESEFVVDVAADGESGLDFLVAGEYDLVISDVMMPGMDGIEFFRRAGSVLGPKRPPFLFLTARADDRGRMEALDEGALDYIGKPFDEVELRRKIDNIVSFKKSFAGTEIPKSVEDVESMAKRSLKAGGLSDREIEVAMLLGRGASKKEIAAELKISVATAKRHTENIYAKLGLQDRFQLFAKYMRLPGD